MENSGEAKEFAEKSEYAINTLGKLRSMKCVMQICKLVSTPVKGDEMVLSIRAEINELRACPMVSLSEKEVLPTKLYAKCVAVIG